MRIRRSLTSIPHLYRNVRRWTEILSVLSKYGLADWLSRVNFPFVKDRIKAADGKVLSRMSHSARIRMALTELGPTFIKFGQLLSTRPDVVGSELATELTRLQCDAPADSFDLVRQEVEQQLRRPLDEIFEWIDEAPLASASIGQVHAARLKDGRRVVVKVRHVGIERTIETDLEILHGLAQMAQRVEDWRAYHPVPLVNEMSRAMRRELDFRREERNLRQFAEMFNGQLDIVIPHPVAGLCTASVLVMDHVDGIKLTAVDQLRDAGLDLDDLARRGADLYLAMIFRHGFYHADPHPGNWLIADDGTIGLLDFGMVGRLSDSLREDLEALLLAIVNRDVTLAVALVRRVGDCPIDLDEPALANEVADLVGQHAGQALKDFDMSSALGDFVGILRHYRITLPSEAALLIKVLITLEGTARLLSPQFNLMSLMKPIHRWMLARRLSPVRQAKKMRRVMLQIDQLVGELPKSLNSILRQVQLGKFDVHLDHRRLGPSVNRLVLGMIVSAMFVGSSLMLSYRVPPLLWRGGAWGGIGELSILGLAGCATSIVVGLRLILAIRKSGNLDRDV
jgi:ubiquinone biosynthesis protein